MSPPKITGQVTSCGTCPNYRYNSGGTYQCDLVDQIVLDKNVVAPFCPLPDFPSQIIADMEMTIRGLRKPLEYGFGLTLLTHIAAKLKINVDSSGSGIAIPLKGGRKVYLALDYITKITLRPFEIAFTRERSTFRLSPDADPPLLHEATDSEGRRWYQHELG